MKVCVCGSRTITDYEVVEKAIRESGFKITELVSGECKGVDQTAEQWARKNKIPIKTFKPDWKNLDAPGAVVKDGDWGPFNANAGPDRDRKMAEYADAVISVHNGSPGTAHTIRACRDLGKPLFDVDLRTSRADSEFLYVFGQGVG